MDMKFVDTVATPDVSDLRVTSDGYLVGSLKCARTGIQVYSRQEMGLPGSGTVNVYRPEDAVFNKDSMGTFAGKPVTLHHPPVPVTADNWKDYAVGTVGETVARDGETVRVQFALMDANTIQAVKDGTREISMGYSTPVVMRDGVAPDGTPYQAVQTGPIRINHLAIVDKARGGENLNVPFRDSHWGISPVNVKDDKPMHKVIIDGISVEVNDQAREVITKLQGQIADQAKTISDQKSTIDTKDRELATKDTELTAKDKAIEDAKSAVPTGAVLDALVAERQKIVDSAKILDPDLKVDGMSNADIQKALVRSSLTDKVVDAKLAGKSDAYVDAFYDTQFDRLVDEADSTKKMADGISKVRPANIADAEAVEDAAFNKSVSRFDRKAK